MHYKTAKHAFSFSLLLNIILHFTNYVRAREPFMYMEIASGHLGITRQLTWLYYLPTISHFHALYTNGVPKMDVSSAGSDRCPLFHFPTTFFQAQAAFQCLCQSLLTSPSPRFLASLCYVAVARTSLQKICGAGIQYTRRYRTAGLTPGVDTSVGERRDRSR